jgi:hypothetical protein
MFSIVHRVFYEYFENCDIASRAEMIDALSEQLVHMVHTKDGANVAMQCIWYGTAKDRKKIIKSMKSFLLKIANEEYGHMALIAIFDSVDDTKFVSKSVLDVCNRLMKVANHLNQNLKLNFVLRNYSARSSSSLRTTTVARSSRTWWRRVTPNSSLRTT